MDNKLQLFNFEGNQVRTLEIKNKPRFIGKDVAKILGYKNLSAALSQHVDKEDCKHLSRNEDDDLCPAIWNNKHDFAQKLFINKNGLEQLVSSSRMPNAISIAQKLGINVNHILNTRKEQDSIHAILKTFKGENMVRQYRVGTYYIDLYFPKYKLVIECDEFGHSDRDQDYEKTRQYYIEDKLGCKFIRYNPDSKDYNIFNVLNRIYKEIYR